MSNIDKHAVQAVADLKAGYTLGHADVEIIQQMALDAVTLMGELEAKDVQIANLTAERDALREGEMGDAKHSNTRAAADIYFQLVEECEIPPGGSLVEYVSDLRERAAVAGKGE